MNSILQILPAKIRQQIPSNMIFQEIRLRERCPVILKTEKREIKLEHIVTNDELLETLDYISNYSLYAYENEVRQGFLTIRGGHRVGVAGEVIIEHGKVKNFKYISSINIRVAHEIKGCADKLFPLILENDLLCHTLIISPPGCGKTTLLRDLIRQFSDGNKYIDGVNVSIVDERSEIGACYHGVPQNNLGWRADILDGCPKAEGMMMLIRSMSPEVLAIDELGSKEEIQALYYAMNSGIIMLATIHGGSLEDIKKKPLFVKMIEEKWFQRYIVLKRGRRVGELEGVYDGKGKRLCG